MKQNIRLLTALGFLLLSTLLADAQEMVRSGAVIRTSAQNVQLYSGESSEVVLKLVRSKQTKRMVFDLLQVQEVEGLHTSIHIADEKDTYILKVTPTSISEGHYQLIVQGSRSDRNYLTSMVLPVEVLSKRTVISANQ
ncbi:MAG: hypothetical protein JXR03_16945 [Cyclobacteriaceae bacterium]